MPQRSMGTCLFIVWLLSTGIGFSQISDKAEVTGRVIDETGAVLPGVALTLKNDATGFRISQVSSDIGDFVFQLVPAGSYELMAELRSFETLRVRSLRLSSNQRLSLGILTLKVGSPAVEISVTGEVNQIDTSSSLQFVFSEEQVQDLPLMTGIFGRSVQSSLIGLVPGASNFDTQATPADLGDPSFPARVVINGSAPGGGIGFSVNGIDATDYGEVGALSGGPNQDAVREFSILTHTFSADSGNMSAQISVETKSGTNDFHGQLRLIHLDPTASAREFFTPDNKKAGYRVETGGGQFSGPVRLPRYNGRNRTFFFFDTEVSRSRNVTAYPATVLSVAERAGDFSELPPNQWPIDPQTRLPFPDGKIPTGRVLTQSRRFIDELMRPAENGRSISGIIDEPFATRQDTVRIDHRFSERDMLQISLFENKWTEESPDPAMVERIDRSREWSEAASIQHTYVLSPHAVNSFAFGRTLNRYDSERVGQSARDNLRNTGFNITSDVNWGFPQIQFSKTGYFNTGYRRNYRTGLWTFKDDFAFSAGRHSTKAGVSVRIDRGLRQLSPGITFTFSDSNPNGTGNEVADFLLGLPGSFSQAAQNNVFAERTFSAFYFQDDFKVNSNLTLNLGLRYEWSGAWSDAGGHRAVFRPGVQSMIVASAPVGMLFPGDVDPITGKALVKSEHEPDRNNFGPRIGVAYSPSSSGGFWGRITGGPGRTSIRSGYGIYYIASPIDTVLKSYAVPPWSLSVARDASQLRQFGGSFLNPWGNSIDPFTLAVNDRTVTRPVGGIYYVEPKAREAYEQQWSFSISRQLPGSIAFSADYAGNTAMHLYRRYQVNPGVLTPTASVDNVESRRMYSDFGAIWAFAADGRSDYHALQLEANRRFTSKFQFNGSYVWSKSLDNAGTGNYMAFLGTADRDATPWSRSNSDRPHQVVFTGVWELPSLQVPCLRDLLSGWQLTSIVEVRSGVPLNLRNQYDSTLRGGDPTTIELIGPFRRLDPREERTFMLPNGAVTTGHFFFDPTSFVTIKPVVPAQARTGNLGRNPFTGLGKDNIDISLLKSVSIAERHRAELRLDVTNLLNHPQFVFSSRAAIDTRAAVFGQTNHTTGPRRVQFVLKYSF